MRTGLAVLAIVAVCAGACGGDSGGGPSGPSVTPPPSQPPAEPGPAPSAVTVSMSGLQFTPSSVNVKAGGTVTWTNNDGVAHTATGTGFDTGILGNGASSSRTFGTAGTFNYVCSLHAGMAGQVVVVP